MKTAKVLKFLTIASSSLTILAGGLALLPIDSANLPMPPEWRPYLAGAALIAGAIARVAVPLLDNAIAKLKEP